MAIVNATANVGSDAKVLNIKFPKGSKDEQRLEDYMGRNDCAGTVVLKRAVEDLFFLDDLLDDAAIAYAEKHNIGRDDLLRRAVASLIQSDSDNSTDIATDNSAGE